ncbi:5204_t:CDS:1 [Ambispora gerdemannii]|uniref:5204_t:CDS:1 n=1 Tax=Ambispora gerdemannii TaxID=144530 RepID=A0A9N9B2V3_9GLOM|nr:5204_t:CDS:1 [Ambispora gerdemannii]
MSNDKYIKICDKKFPKHWSLGFISETIKFYSAQIPESPKYLFQDTEFPFSGEISDHDKHLIKKVKVILDTETLSTGDDFNIAESIEKWCQKNDQTPEKIYRILKKNFLNSPAYWSCLLGFFEQCRLVNTGNLNKALRFYNIAAAGSDAFAANQVGFIHPRHAHNSEYRLKFYKRAADGDHVHGYLNLTNKYYFDKQFRKYFICFYHSACKGYLKVYDHVSMCYSQGCGVKKDKHMAFRWKLRLRNATNILEEQKRKNFESNTCN